MVKPAAVGALPHVAHANSAVLMQQQPPEGDGRDFAAFARSDDALRLRSVLVAKLGYHDGNEATAEALAFAAANWSRVSGARSAVAYLSTVGWRTINRNRRRRNASQIPLSEIDPPSEEGHSVDVDLERALGRLTDRQRTAVVLIHAFGWTHREVASALGLRVTSVQNHAERGLAKLRTILDYPEAT